MTRDLVATCLRAPSGWRRLRITGPLARSAAIALLAFTASCTGIDNFINEQASPTSVFSVGYENVATRYIEPVDMRRVAMSGLATLVAMDPDLDIREEPSRVRLLTGNRTLGYWRAPSSSDFLGWADVSARFVEAARANSVIIRSRPSADVYAAVFDGALSNLDRYSRYATAEKARRRQSARNGFGGLGISIDQQNGVTTVVEVYEGTPAMRAGLKEKDVLTFAGRTPLYGLAQSDIVDLLRGPVDTSVALTVERPGVEDPLRISVVRALIVVPTVEVERDDDLLVIRVAGFNHGTASTIRREIEAAISDRDRPLTGIVLDLRSNPGGLLDQAVRVSDLFLTDGRIVSTKGRHRASDQIFDATGDEIAESIPLAVLVNGKSASAAEIVAAALQDRERAIIFGSSSYGKGSVQTITRLPNGGELTLTWARLYSPGGRALQGQGVIPAICTNGGGKSIEELRKDLRSVLNGTGGTFLAEIRAHHARIKDFQTFRAECPPNSSKPESDLEIARLVMTDDVLYSRIVHHGPSSVAAQP